MLTQHKLAYLGLLFIPLLGLCFRAPLLLLAAVPPLAINLLSSSHDQSLVNSHYAASIAAVLFGATIFGAARSADPARLASVVLPAAFLTAVISPFWTALPVARDVVTASPLLQAERHAVGTIPDGVTVSASNKLGGHLSNLRRILLFPVIRDANWIAVDTADTEGASSFRAVVERLRKRRSFAIVSDSHGIVVMRRKAQPSRLPGPA